MFDPFLVSDFATDPSQAGSTRTRPTPLGPLPARSFSALWLAAGILNWFWWFYPVQAQREPSRGGEPCCKTTNMAAGSVLTCWQPLSHNRNSSRLTSCHMIRWERHLAHCSNKNCSQAPSQRAAMSSSSDLWPQTRCLINQTNSPSLLTGRPEAHTMFAQQNQAPPHWSNWVDLTGH